MAEAESCTAISFMDALSCIDQCFITNKAHGEASSGSPAQIGKTKAGGIDLNKPRMR